jgi:adenosylcobyric acid synthase
MVILPGSKLTIDDLQWLKHRGIDKRILEFDGVIFGICGGYEKLCQKVGNEDGLGLIDDTIVFRDTKVLNRGKYQIFGIEVSGFELHEGVSSKQNLHYHRDNIYATFVHEVFDSDEMRNMIFTNINPNYQGYDFAKYKQNKIANFMQSMKKHLDIEGLIQCIQK